ncbi:PREDICTED: thioredoxin domain-containing protein 17-like isoform X2 [Papilio polytes]|uniref:thioredoxin domain-containing protein 17-like isoform X2 n=1 Tax=Papilio polytes TaxID=76194 RepID=UPI00067676F0|nr:PREDICTED: thioredoxin domain-containing protein 17-like isoform X2 [Papilio polytes]
MVTLVNIKGFEEFSNYTASIDAKGPPVLIYFSGSKNAEGRSWCPDCVEAEPVIKAFLDELKRNVVFAYVDVGDRDYWKDRACPFRTDSRTKLLVIPTIIKWKGVQRLEGSQCTKRDLLQMLFEEDD